MTQRIRVNWKNEKGYFYTDLHVSGGEIVRIDPIRGRKLDGIVVATPAQQTALLGDRVANGIKKATLGLVKPCAGCDKRRRALNTLDQRFRDRIRGRS